MYAINWPCKLAFWERPWPIMDRKKPTVIDCLWRPQSLSCVCDPTSSAPSRRLNHFHTLALSDLSLFVVTAKTRLVRRACMFTFSLRGQWYCNGWYVYWSVCLCVCLQVSVRTFTTRSAYFSSDIISDAVLVLTSVGFCMRVVQPRVVSTWLGLLDVCCI